MELSHSLATNAQLLDWEYQKEVEIRHRVEHLLFIPVCLYRGNKIWEEVDRGSTRGLEVWLEGRHKYLMNLCRSIRAWSLDNTYVYFLVGKEMALSSIAIELMKEAIVCAGKERCRTLKIDLRPFSNLSLSESYRAGVAIVIREVIHQRRTNSIRMILASRLDSDDMFTEEYYRNVRIAALSIEPAIRDGHEFLVDMPQGIQYLERTQSVFYTLWPEGTFPTIVYRHAEKPEDVMPHHVPFSYAHDEVPKDLKRIVVSTIDPQWIQVIHEGNVMNGIFRWSRLKGKCSLENLGRREGGLNA